MSHDFEPTHHRKEEVVAQHCPEHVHSLGILWHKEVVLNNLKDSRIINVQAKFKAKMMNDIAQEQTEKTNQLLFKKQQRGSSLVIAQLVLGSFTAVALGSVPGWGTEIPQVEWHSQYFNKKENKWQRKELRKKTEKKEQRSIGKWT